MSSITTRNLTKKFGSLVAVSDVDFDIETNRIQAVIGPNGAGKTTLISCITGRLEPTSGSIEHNGESIEGLQQFEIARRGIAIAEQLVSIYPTQSVLGNVATAAHMKREERMWDAILHTKRHREEKAQLREDALEHLETVGLANRVGETADTLAYGQKKRLMIASALVAEPEFLILDEPVAGLNPEESDRIMGILNDIVDEFGIGVVLIEHDMDIVMNYSDWVTVLENGQKIAESTPSEVQNDERVQRAYLG